MFLEQDGEANCLSWSMKDRSKLWMAEDVRIKVVDDILLKALVEIIYLI